MSGHHIDRINEDIRRELTDILRGLKDPRISGLISIVRVELARDLSFAKVYVSSMDGLDAAKRAVEGLKSASGFIRREINLRLSLRRSPQFIFVATDSIEYGVDIAGILNKLNKNQRENDPE